MLPAWRPPRLLDRGRGRAKQTHESEITPRYVIGGGWHEARAPR